MTFSDETLMAFADDELDAATYAAVEAAMREDPELEKRVAQHRALRAKLQHAFAAALEEAPPERLMAAAAGRLRSMRRPAQPARSRVAIFRWQPVAMAASVVVGLVLGHFIQRQSSAIIVDRGGGLLASGALAQGLTNQLSSERGPAAVHMGLSFVAKSGEYCRTFTMTAPASPAGVACRRGNAWQIRALTQPTQPTQPSEPGAGDSAGTYRTAASALPPLILDEVQRQMTGEPLDQNGELAARRQGWRQGH
ncbi:MAG: hypothetical protein M3N97_16880 [Pseudomonadota bacterium]|nr:hypothetical protein [Pseudomonadota bacterium]